MEPSPSECITSLNDEEENESALWRLLFKEREGTMSEENIKLIERSCGLKKEYHTLENADTSSYVDSYQDGGLGDFENYIREDGDPVFDRNIKLQLWDISNRFTANNVQNRNILEICEEIDRKTADFNSLVDEAKIILAEKMTLVRELNEVNEQITYHSLEDTKLKRVQKKRGTDCAKTGSCRRTYFCRFGIPYFKTKDRFPASQNADLKEIIKNKEVMVIRMPPIRRILQQDTRQLDTFVLNQLKGKRIQQLQTRLKHLVKPEHGNAEYEQQAQNLRGAIETTRAVNDVRDTKDWNIEVDFLAMSKLSSRFSCDDYERMWRLLGHPGLSRDEFMKDEQEKLKELVHQYGCQDWDRIAEALGTRRSGFVCFNKWVSLARKGTREPWTAEEDDLLRKLCCKVDGIKDSANLYHYWRYIRRQFPHRTYTQIHGHWKYKLAPTLKKGRFTEVETEKMERLIGEGKSFGEIAAIFQTRSSVQLRSHYTQIIERASSNSGAWTAEEEVTLFRLIDKYGSNDWVKISKELGTRNRSQCRLKFLQGAWSPSETQRFQDLLHKYGTDFGKISQEIGTKSLAQCRMKYIRQKESERDGAFNEGRWSRKETRLFRDLVDKYSDDFRLISQELRTRSVEQCQEKYERMTQRNAKYPIVKRIEVKVLDGAQEDRILNVYKDDAPSVNRTTRWTECEKEQFRRLLLEYGNEFDKISRALRTKSIKQCRNMFQKLEQNDQEVSPTKKVRRTAVKRQQPLILPTWHRPTSAPTAAHELSSQPPGEDPLKENIEENAAPVTNQKKARARMLPKKFRTS